LVHQIEELMQPFIGLKGINVWVHLLF
jgi:hypothetical protein